MHTFGIHNISKMALAT